MGLTSIFSNAATFGGIVNPVSSSADERPQEPVRVTSIVQDAFIDVNEIGTIASAKTTSISVV